MSYADKILTCRECGAEFVFSTAEQAFYAQKGFVNEPTRCHSCRQQRKLTRGDERSGGYRQREGAHSHGDSGGYRSTAREMHTVVCAACGKAAQVPFLPRGDKPVYCADCFQQRRRSGW